MLLCRHLIETTDLYGVIFRTVFDRLLAPVMPILQRIEHERPKHGNETLAWLELVRTLVYFFTRRCESRND